MLGLRKSSSVYVESRVRNGRKKNVFRNPANIPKFQRNPYKFPIWEKLQGNFGIPNGNPGNEGGGGSKSNFTP